MKMHNKIATLLLFSLAFSAGLQADDLAANKALVKNFYQEVFVEGNIDAVDKYIGDTYIQHNPNLPDGKAALKDLLSHLPKPPKDAPPSSELVRVIAEDDLVVLHIHNKAFPPPNGGAIVDIYRIEEGKIVEHWDVIQAIPSESANDNTMF